MSMQIKSCCFIALWFFSSVTHAYIHFKADDMAQLKELLENIEQADSDESKALQADIRATLAKTYRDKPKRDVTTGLFGYRLGEVVTDTLGTFYDYAEVAAPRGHPLLHSYQIQRDADKRTVMIRGSVNHDSGKACYHTLATVRKSLQAQSPNFQLLADSDWQSVWFTRNAMFSLKCFLDEYRFTASVVDLAHPDYPEGMEAMFREALVHDTANQLLGKPTQFIHYAMPLGNEYFFNQYQQLKHAENPTWAVRPWWFKVLVSSDGRRFVTKSMPPKSKAPETVLFTVWQAAGIHFGDKIATVTLGDLYDTKALEKLPVFGEVVGWGEWQPPSVEPIDKKFLYTELAKKTMASRDKLLITTRDKRVFELDMRTGKLQPKRHN